MSLVEGLLGTSVCRAILYVVVNEEGVVQKFERNSTSECELLRGAKGFRGRETQLGAEALCRAKRIVEDHLRELAIAERVGAKGGNGVTYSFQASRARSLDESSRVHLSIQSSLPGADRESETGPNTQ